MKEKKRQFLGKLFFVPRSLGTGGASGRGPDVVREGGIGGWGGGGVRGAAYSEAPGYTNRPHSTLGSGP